MRLSISGLGFGIVASIFVVACGSSDGPGIRRNTASGDEPNAPSGPAETGSTPTGTAPTAGCAADAPAAQAITTEGAAEDVRLVQGDVIHREASKIFRTKKDGTGRVELYTSNDLVHSYADEQFVVTVESPNAPNAVLKIIPLAGAPGGAVPGTPGAPVTVNPNQTWLAAGTHVFASDAMYFYVLADVQGTGDTIYRVSKQTPQVQEALANLEAPLSDPQLAGTDVWFVRDQNRVYKITQLAGEVGDEGAGQGPAQPATEVFAIGYAGCRLAVGGDRAYCSTGTSIEARDLKGANVATVVDTKKESSPQTLGSAMYGGNMLFVRTLPTSATDVMKHGIRMVGATGTTVTEKTVACGRDEITSVSADATTVVWSERGKGVFTAPR